MPEGAAMAVDVREWLEALGLGAYAGAFAENAIDGHVLAHLTAEDLKEIGVAAVGHRRRMLEAIAALSGVSDAPGATAAPSRPEAPEGERRHVTVLFADICGFTAISESMDGEALHALLAAYFERVDGIVLAHGGTVDKHIGDSVMAVFGAPVSRGNEAERAVRAAIAIQEAMPDLGRRLGRAIATHIGIASGQVMASGIGSDAHYTVIGSSVNLAARLTDAAGPGAILVSGDVERAISGLLAAADLGEIPIRGVDAPQRVFSIEGTAEDDGRRYRHPFVGRQAEIRQFEAALTLCLETGRGQLILIRGDAGIGKTRLAAEFCRIAAGRDVACHRSLVLDFGVGRGQDPIRSLVRSFLALSAESDEAARRAAVERALSEGLAAEASAVHLYDLLDLPQPPAQKALYDAMDNPTRNAGKKATLAALARGLGRRRPRMIMVEDLHWADALALDHLAELANAAADAPLLLVTTTRIEGDPLGPVWRAGILGAPFMTLDLGPLGEREALDLAEAYGGGRSPLARACIERAGGNPLFLEQLLLNAQEAGDVDVPGTVQSIVQARLDNLAPRDKAAVQAASVLGQRFARSALGHLIGDDAYDCATLADHHLVRRQGEHMLFSHALIQEGVYGSLLRSRRDALHLRAAEWYASRDPALHAEHLARAGDPRAAGAYADAARSLAGALRYERARQLAEAGLELAVDRADIHRLTCQLGELLRELDRPDQSIAAYEAALANADDDEGRCRAWLGIAEGMRIVERIDEALAILDRVEPVAAAEALPDVLMRLHHLRGNLLFPKGDIAGCAAGHAESLRLAREIGSAEGEARGLGGLGDAAYAAGRMRTAHDELTRCVEISRAHGLGRVEVANQAQICHTKIYLLALEEALALGDATIEAARRVGHDRAALNALVACHFAATEMLDWDRAEVYWAEIPEIARRIGSTRFENESVAFAGLRRHAEGCAEDGLAMARSAIAKAREGGLSFGGPRILGILARISDDADERASALAEGERVIAAGCVGHNQLYFYRHAIDVALEDRAWDEADRYADALEAFAGTEPLPWTRFFAARGRAMARRGRGADDPALMAALARLREEAEAVRLAAALPGLDQALAPA